MKMLSPRLMLNALALSALSMISCVSNGPVVEQMPVHPISPDKLLVQLLQEALEGNRQSVRSFLRLDVAVNWPQFANRLVVTQGDGEDATTKTDFMHDFSVAHALASKSKPDSAELTRLGEEEFRQSRIANGDGVPISRPVTIASGERFAVVSIPSSVCTTCAKLPPAKSMAELCKPIHPDTLFFEGRARMRTLFHEEAHSVRHMLGLFKYNNAHEQHREEIIANLYADMRLIQIYGEAGVAGAERIITLEPLRHGSSRYYLNIPAQLAMLDWYHNNAADFKELSPANLLEHAALIAEPKLYTPDNLKLLGQFEAQTPFIQIGAGGRLKLAKEHPEGNEDVRDAQGCKWNYPALMRNVDTRAIALSAELKNPIARYFASNPHRPVGLQSVAPFGFDPSNVAQTEAMQSFNNSYRANICTAFTLDDMKPKRITMPAPAIAPPTAKSLALCPQ